MVGEVRPPAGRDQQLVGGAPPGRRRGRPRSVPSSYDTEEIADAGDDLDALARRRRRVDQRARLGLLEREQPVGDLEDGDRDPEPGEDLANSTTDRPSADARSGSRAGPCSWTASRFVQYGVRPGPGSAAPPASVPVLSTTPRRARTLRPRPATVSRTRQPAVPADERSRRCRPAGRRRPGRSSRRSPPPRSAAATGAQSGVTVAVPARPGIRRAFGEQRRRRGSSSCSARIRSTGTRLRPAARRCRPPRGLPSASSVASDSPPGPSPTTTTSTSVLIPAPLTSTCTASALLADGHAGHADADSSGDDRALYAEWMTPWPDGPGRRRGTTYALAASCHPLPTVAVTATDDRAGAPSAGNHLATSSRRRRGPHRSAGHRLVERRHRRSSGQGGRPYRQAGRPRARLPVGRLGRRPRWRRQPRCRCRSCWAGAPGSCSSPWCCGVGSTTLGSSPRSPRRCRSCSRSAVCLPSRPWRCRASVAARLDAGRRRADRSRRPLRQCAPRPRRRPRYRRLGPASPAGPALLPRSCAIGAALLRRRSSWPCRRRRARCLRIVVGSLAAVAVVLAASVWPSAAQPSIGGRVLRHDGDRRGRRRDDRLHARSRLSAAAPGPPGHFAPLGRHFRPPEGPGRTSRTRKPLADANRSHRVTLLAEPSLRASPRRGSCRPRARRPGRGGQPGQPARSSSCSAGLPIRIGGFDQISSNARPAGYLVRQRRRAPGRRPRSGRVVAASCSARSLTSTAQTSASGTRPRGPAITP